MYKKIKQHDFKGDAYDLENSIMRISDGAQIPFDENNIDYQDYLKWLDGYEITPEGWVKTSDGNQPLPSDE